jgi:hypothetical protein
MERGSPPPRGRHHLLGVSYCPGPVVAHGSYSKHATRIHPSAWKGNSRIHRLPYWQVNLREFGASLLTKRSS